MKTLKFYSLALMAGMSLFTACSSSDDDNNGIDNGSNENEIAAGTTLSGSITKDTYLTAGNAYKLSGQYSVEDGATLYIEEGVTITAVGGDDVVDYILVKQGGKINAVGTADKPIVMTSTDQMAGAWGGIHICGKAQTNIGTGKSEIGDANYGGSDDADNSGKLQYVRVEYSGYAFSADKEANGITFYGVGSGTTVDHCEAYKGSDDGFEFFGGTVNISNMVVVSCSDDSYDWTEGWRGKGTDLVAYQEAQETLGYDCDCLIEADNNENDFAATPVSCPTLKNLTFVGNNSAEGKRGIRLRRGTQVNIDGAQVCGKKNCVTLESQETEDFLTAGTASLKNMTVSTELKSEKGTYTNEQFVAAGNIVDSNLNMTLDDIKAACTWMTGNWVK